ncbi:MAG: hypothetical protein ACFFA3_21230 [Promethearchaeota archaeon]
MKISEKYESFDEEKVENIVNELIKSGIIFSVGIEPALYQKIQRVATKLGYMDIEPMDLGRSYVLRNEDYLKISDKVWQYIVAGILAPGNNRNNPWFPHLHLTEKGKEILEKNKKIIVY